MKVRWKIRQSVFLLISGVFLTLACFSLSSAEIDFSPDIPVTLGGTVFDERDVVLYDSGFSMEVDGEAMGLPKGVHISAFTNIDPEIVFAVDAPVTLDGSDYSCQDIIIYSGSSFVLLDSVSTFGAQPGACVDALHYVDTGEYLYFSLDVPADLTNVPDLQPHDIYGIDLLSTTYFKAFDGSDHGIPEGVNLDATDISDDGHIRMSFDVPTEFASLEVTSRDVCDYDENATSWSLSFDGDSAGMPEGMNVEAITLSDGVVGGCDCEGNFDDDEDVDGSDASAFKEHFGRSGFNRPCISVDPCNGDFDCDGDVDGSDASVFKEDFGRSPFFNPCPVCTRDPWCGYDDRFTDNGDGTITDNQSGLIWLKDANCFNIGMNWDDAMDTAANVANGLCGLTDGSSVGDWRLATIDEWENFFCIQYTDPALCNTIGTGQWSDGDPFTNPPLGTGHHYWTSTETSPINAWAVYLYNGYSIPTHKGNFLYYVWPVRDGY